MDFDKVKEAVRSIEMSKTSKDQMKENLYKVDKERSASFNYKRWISIACTFSILLLIIIIIPTFNNNGTLGSTFTITAYASSDDTNQSNKLLSTEKATFELLSTEQRAGVPLDISGDGRKLIFTDINLKISGEDIDSITYSLSNGNFIEEVSLTHQQYADKDWLLSKKIYMIFDKTLGMKEIGDTYTVKYNEQDKFNYTLAIPHDGNYVVVDEIFIEVVVTYTDGNIEKQNILVNQEVDNTISLILADN